MKKLLLVDGNSMLFRAYYATAYGTRMTSSNGTPTNAIFGFSRMLQKALDLVEPDAVLVAFDAGKHTFRHDLYADYKGTRKHAPDDLVPQFQLVRDYLDAFAIKWVEMQDIEADDLIGTMSRNTPEFDTIILTSDRDMLQLIEQDTCVMLMKKGISEMAEMNLTSLKEEYGITPSQVIDLKALMGDSADNIPGIKGIGEKTAMKLLDTYGTVDEVLAHADEIKGAAGKKIQAGIEMAKLSKQLATIRCDVPLDFTVDACMFEPNYKTLVQFFEGVDMYSMAKKYQVFVQDEQQEELAAEVCSSVKHVMQVPSNMLDGDLTIFVHDNQDSQEEAIVYGLALFDGTNAVYITIDDAMKDDALKSYLTSEHRLISYDNKRSMHVLKRYGMDVLFDEDAMIVASLVDSTLTSTAKIQTAFELVTTKTYDEIYGTKARPKLVDFDDEILYACESCMNIHRLFEEAYARLEQANMVHVYRDIDLPLTNVLFAMEETGIRCEVSVLEEIAKKMKALLDEEERKIVGYAGKEFNVNSPKQLGEVLFDDLALPHGKKRSTSADQLEKLKGSHPIIEPILVYRKLSKIYSTYADGLQKYIREDGRIHTIYNQAATQTGRLSSSEPNLQNISVRDEQGKEIRKAFMASEGHTLISCDYHQIELRMLADMADEKQLIAAFNEGIDVHTKTAMDIFDVSMEDVTSDMRRKAKTVNFGVVYGISDFGLAEQLGCTRKEAKQFIATYYEKYPRIQTYMQELVAFCEAHGYVETLSGRRREIPEIHNKSFMMKEFGKRAAMNAPIQGSAADLIKLAMLKIDAMMKEKNVQSKMILQVHDELIFDVVNEEIDVMKQIIEDGMVHAMELKVPLTVEMNCGQTWYEAK